MLFGVLEGSSLELRAVEGRRVISGRFPYNKWAVTSDRGKNGRPRKERFAPGAFQYRTPSNRRFDGQLPAFADAGGCGE